MSDINLIRLPEVIEKIRLKKSSIYHLISLNQFPRPIKLGPRSVAWVESEVDEWVIIRLNQREEDRD
ncbi:TPA: AlpA family transcriptional regulator [Yersinia enterocolitica]|uniref:AlpA family transcriptional regulator n=1 Tax=Yersinia enterocolitica TaxID=630 RepID=UPI0032FAB9C1|nr:AlpA family transcriptional regulator [Yersinia enterocolitica]HDL7329928.1 AlpA family transcriptional regulator [Yersinia enterocolitica]HDL7356342.1 AlpA family transcriptional regulator [Yersinia enterocolitica]HDL7959911.1 AlpA family transcriptional regulator [Yersinia enterocolitica]HDL8228320.1 AlpA family transcriptional regulator [Yersinia enterocolitica]